MATRAVPAPLAQLPNALTVARLLLIPLFVALMVKAGDSRTWPAGVGLLRSRLGALRTGWTSDPGGARQRARLGIRAFLGLENREAG